MLEHVYLLIYWNRNRIIYDVEQVYVDEKKAYKLLDETRKTYPNVSDRYDIIKFKISY